MADASLLRLPSELLYLILNHLDACSVLFSFGLVCKRFYQIIDEYNHYEIDLNSITELGLKRIIRLIQPENITSLILNNTLNDSAQIELFFSLIDINRLTRLRSITLGKIKKFDEYKLLNKIAVSTLVSLGIHSGGIYNSEALAFISKVMTQSASLNQLHLIKSDYTITKISWSSPCNIKHLTIKSCSLKEYNLILQRLPQLQTFITTEFIMDQSMATSSSFTHYQQLILLSIGNSSLSMIDFELLLSLTPSLVVLKLISCRSKLVSILNGSDWSYLIQTKLFHLKTFQFFFSYTLRQEINPEDLDLMIDQFRTPFWLQEKKWIITCDYILENKIINLYTTRRGAVDFEQYPSFGKPFQSSLLTIRFHSTSMDMDSHPILQLLYEAHDIAKTKVCTESCSAILFLK
jgi:hypothetical protein